MLLENETLVYIQNIVWFVLPITQTLIRNQMFISFDATN